MNPPNHDTAVLRFDRLRLGRSGDRERLEPFDLELRRGDLAVIRLRHRVATMLADAASGLVRPADGAVRFLGFDWSKLRTLRAHALRGRIGRVFTGDNWLRSQTVEQNLLLRPMHHTNQPRDELLREAAEWAALLGLPGLPMGPVSRMDPGDLQRAACVRAMLGRPRLLLLADPLQSADGVELPMLVNAIRRHRSRGAAVIWFTADEHLWRSRDIRATHRLCQVQQRLEAHA